VNCLVLGGSHNQIELIKTAKKRGYFVVVVSPYLTDPGVGVADRHIHADIRDVDAIISQLNQKIDLCVSDQSDVGSLAQSIISERLNLIGQPSDVIAAFSDKNISYKKIRQRGCSYHPETHFFSTLNTALDFLNTHSETISDWIVKPVNSQGSKGVFRLGINSEEKVIQAYDESSDHGIIFQRYIIGDHFSVDAVVIDSLVTPLVIAKKQKYPNNENLDKRLLVRGMTDDNFLLYLAKFHAKVVNSLGLVVGLTHGEYVLDASGNLYLIEVAARGGGGNISGKIVRNLTGFNSAEFILDAALGKALHLNLKISKDSCAILHFFDADAVVELSDEPAISKNKGVLHFEYDRKKSVMDNSSPSDSRGRPGYFIVAGPNLKEVQEIENRVIASCGLSDECIEPFHFS
jgi:predicted ATP-grasp superfamily ATP-dependent carboligase